MPAGAARPALTDEERLAKVQERRAALEQELARMRGEEKSLLGEVEQLELELRLRTEELTEIQITLRRTRARARRHGRPRAASSRRAWPRPGPPWPPTRARSTSWARLSYLRLLLSIDRPSDFFRGYRFITTLARRDNARVAALPLRPRGAHPSRRRSSRSAPRESIALRGRLAAARRNLDAQRARKTELLTSLVERKELNAAYVEELAEAESRLAAAAGRPGRGRGGGPARRAFGARLPWPVEGRVRAGFGRRKHPRFDTYTIHNGIEIEAPPDAPVRAVHEGRVVFADRFRGYGLMVVVDHGGKHHSLYAQLAEIDGRRRDRRSRRVTVLGTADPAGAAGPGRLLRDALPGPPRGPPGLAREALSRPATSPAGILIS